MVINNRRDAGYTIISRFENSFRLFLAEKLSMMGSDFRENIPSGIIKKCEERKSSQEWEEVTDFFDETDFPDLKEITLFKGNHQVILKNEISKNDFSSAMEELYLLRCKIAHVKGYFTSIDLDKLIELSSIISDALKFEDYVTMVRNDFKTV